VSEEEVDEEFLEEHLMIIDTHLKLLEQAIVKFRRAYSSLTTEKLNPDDFNHRVIIWSCLENLCHSCWSIAQIINPQIMGPKGEKNELMKKQYKSFLKQRGSQIRALMSLTLSNKNSLNGMRNSWVHVDERLDEWYCRLISTNQKPKKIKYRTLANGACPDLNDEIANLFWFDYNSGKFYNLGEDKSHNIVALKTAVDLANDGLIKADDLLQKKFPQRTRILSEAQ